jgi:hypothetical protein
MHYVLDSTGITPHTQPAVYTGTALMVVRDAAGYPLVAFDGNGTTFFLADQTYLEAHDLKASPITDDDIRAAILEGFPE